MSVSNDAPAPASGGSAEGARAPKRPRPVFLLLGFVIAIGITFALVLALDSSISKSNGKPNDSGPAGPVPTFSLERVGGRGSVGVPADGGGNGRPAILLFFASWCTPCKREIPALARVYDRQHASRSPLDKVAVIGVDGNDPTQNALSFMRSSKVEFPVGADVVYSVTQAKFGFSGLPESVFVTGSGRIAGIHYGALSPSAFVSWEHKLLAGA